MSAGNVIVQIRRKQGRFDFIPDYSTAQLLQGVCHLAHVPKNDLDGLELSTICDPGNAEKKRRSINKFKANKEEIYTMLAQGRGVKPVADHFHIGYVNLQRYLQEEESK